MIFLEAKKKMLFKVCSSIRNASSLAPEEITAYEPKSHVDFHLKVLK